MRYVNLVFLYHIAALSVSSRQQNSSYLNRQIARTQEHEGKLSQKTISENLLENDPKKLNAKRCWQVVETICYVILSQNGHIELWRSKQTFIIVHSV